MAFAKVAESTFTVATGEGSENKSLPGPPSEGDLVIVVLASDANLISDGISTSGYTVLYKENAINPGQEVSYKVMTATPDTIVTILQEGTKDTAGLIQVWSGQHATTVIDTTTTTGTSGSGMPDAPSITTVTDGALVFAVGMLDDDVVASSVTAPSGYTNLLAAEAGTDEAGATVMIASKVVTTAGAEDPDVFGGSGSDQWRSVTIAIRPAAAATTSITPTVGSSALVGVAGLMDFGVFPPRGKADR